MNPHHIGPPARGGWQNSGPPDLLPVAYPSQPIQYPQLLWRRKVWLLGIMLLGAMVGFTWVIVQAPSYRASSLIELIGVNERFMGMSQLDPQAGTGNYSVTAANMQTQTRILTSGGLLGRVIERVNLEMTPINSTPTDFFSKLRNRLGIVQQEPVELMRQAIGEAAGTTRARPVGASRLIEVTCESISPEVAASFVNALANEYILQNVQSRSSSTLRTSQWMEGQLDEMRSRREVAERKLQEFIRRSGNAFVLDQATLDDSKLRQLQAELSASQADRITKQSRWELARSSPVDSLPEILDDGRMWELKGKISELRRERAQLMTTFTNEHSKVMQVDAQIAELEQTLQTEKTNLVRRIQNEYEASVRREKMLFDAYRSQSGILATQGENAVEYLALKGEAEMTRQVHNDLLQQMSQAAVIAALPTTTVRVVEAATPGKVPIKPQPLRDILLSTFASGALMAGVIVLRERRRLKHLAEVFAVPGHSGMLLAVPELGVIPTLETEKKRWYFPLPSRGGATGPNESPTGAKELVSWRQQPSFLAESFRYVIASLFSPRNRLGRSVMLISSPGPGDGKTTFAANLAITASTTGRRTLLIDADLRRPRLHEVFNVPLAPGLREILVADTPVESINLGAHIRRGVAELDLIAAGQVNDESQSAALLFSPRLVELMERLRREYELVVIDSTPALHFPDSRLLGRLSDGVVLVVRSGFTHRDSALAAADAFKEDGIPVLGTILNDWTPADPTGANGFYEYGRYQQHYGKSRAKTKSQ